MYPHTAKSCRVAARRIALGSRAALPMLITATLLAGYTAPAASAHTRRSCRNAHASVFRASRAELRRAVVCLINEERSRHHLPRLRVSRDLNGAAQSWTNVMVSHHAFTHGSDFAGRITASGFQWSTAGENIAAGYTTPAAVVSGWMASPGHCRNILTPDFAAVGTGMSRGSPGMGMRGAWTQDFALGMGQRAPSGNWGPANGCPY